MPCWDAELFSVVLSWFGPNYSQCETVLWHHCSSSKGSAKGHFMITHNLPFSFASTRIYIRKSMSRSAFTFSKQNYTQDIYGAHQLAIAHSTTQYIRWQHLELGLISFFSTDIEQTAGGP